jgi:hypothetical protein
MPSNFFLVVLAASVIIGTYGCDREVPGGGGAGHITVTTSLGENIGKNRGVIGAIGAYQMAGVEQKKYLYVAILEFEKLGNPTGSGTIDQGAGTIDDVDSLGERHFSLS